MSPQSNLKHKGSQGTPAKLHSASSSGSAGVLSPKESPSKKQKYETLLAQLKQQSTVVADTGEFSLIAKYKPQDATTNPSLIYKACVLPQYQHLIEEVIGEWKKEKKQKHQMDEQTVWNTLCDKVIVNFGCEILKIVPGRISTEVDARLSFDTKKTIERAKQIIQLYKEKGIPKERILIKIASTWEGIQACKELTKEGIACNMTLIFTLTQAIAAAEANAYLISPFVGRILDWYNANDKEYAAKEYNPHTDKGVLSVKDIYYYYKKFGYSTIIMGASFRNMKEILELSGCDRLTISPQLLEELSMKNDVKLKRQLKKEDAGTKCSYKDKKKLSESQWRFEMNENRMGIEKLSDGIRGFVADGKKLEALVKEKLQAATKK